MVFKLAPDENNFKQQTGSEYLTTPTKQSKAKQNKETKPLDLNIFPSYAHIFT